MSRRRRLLFIVPAALVLIAVAAIVWIERSEQFPFERRAEEMLPLPAADEQYFILEDKEGTELKQVHGELIDRGYMSTAEDGSRSTSIETKRDLGKEDTRVYEKPGSQQVHVISLPASWKPQETEEYNQSFKNWADRRPQIPMLVVVCSQRRPLVERARRWLQRRLP